VYNNEKNILHYVLFCHWAKNLQHLALLALLYGSENWTMKACHVFRLWMAQQV